MQKSLCTRRYRVLLDEIRRARCRHRWSQAYAADVVGCSRSWLGKIERGELRLDVVQLLHICRCYGIGLRRLLCRLEEEPPDEDGSFLAIRPSGSIHPCSFLPLMVSPPMRRMANTAVRRDSGNWPHFCTASTNSGGSRLCGQSRVHTHLPPLILLEWVVGSSPSASTISQAPERTVPGFCFSGTGRRR